MKFSRLDSRCRGSTWAEVAIECEGELTMTLATTFLAAAFVVSSTLPLEYDDCEVYSI